MVNSKFWSGSELNGNSSRNNCIDWSENSSRELGRTGDTLTESAFFETDDNDCSELKQLLCISQ